MIITSQVKKFLYELCIESIKSFEDTELVYTISELIEYIEQTINILYKLNFEKSIGHYHKHYLFQIIHQIIYECKEKEWFCKLNSFQWKLDYEEFKFNFKPESINYKKQMVDSLNKEPKQRSILMIWAPGHTEHRTILITREPGNTEQRIILITFEHGNI